METVKTKIGTTFEALKNTFGWKNPMQAPRIEKIVVSVGTGRVRKDKQKVDLIEEQLKKITGQKPSARKARKSIASFKLREGEKVGYSVTLHGQQMHNFLNNLINIAIPHTRDFRGIPRTSVDVMGNLTIGIQEHTVFPESADQNIQDIFGLSIVIVTSSKSPEEARAFLEHIGIPFKREKVESGK